MLRVPQGSDRHFHTKCVIIILERRATTNTEILRQKKTHWKGSILRLPQSPFWLSRGVPLFWRDFPLGRPTRMRGAAIPPGARGTQSPSHLSRMRTRTHLAAWSVEKKPALTLVMLMKSPQFWTMSSVTARVFLAISHYHWVRSSTLSDELKQSKRFCFGTCSVQSQLVFLCNACSCWAKSLVEFY